MLFIPDDLTMLMFCRAVGATCIVWCIFGADIAVIPIIAFVFLVPFILCLFALGHIIWEDVVDFREERKRKRADANREDDDTWRNLQLTSPYIRIS